MAPLTWFSLGQSSRREILQRYGSNASWCHCRTLLRDFSKTTSIERLGYPKASQPSQLQPRGV